MASEFDQFDPVTASPGIAPAQRASAGPQPQGNAFDQFDPVTAAAPAGAAPQPQGNAFDQFDGPAANPFDSFDGAAGNVTLSPIQQVQMKSGLQDPENPTGQDNSFLTAMSEGGSPAAFAKNMVALPLEPFTAAASDVAEPIAAKALNIMADVGESDTGIQPGSNPQDQFQPGEPIIPPVEGTGVLATIERAASGMSTPGNLAMLGMAPESKLVQGGFLAQALAAVPGSLVDINNAKTPEEAKQAITQAALNIGMAALMKSGLGEPYRTPGMEHDEVAANNAAVLGSMPEGFRPWTGPEQGHENAMPSFAAPPSGMSSSEPPSERNTAAAPVDLSGLEAAMKENQLKAATTPAVDPSTVEVRTPDGQIDPVRTAIARMRLPENPQVVLNVPAMEAELADRLKNNGSVVSGDFTIEGIKKAMGLPADKQGDTTRIAPMIDAGLIERTPEGNYRFNQNIQRMGTLKPISQPEVEAGKNVPGPGVTGTAPEQSPLTGGGKGEIKGSAAPGTDTVRTAGSDAGNASQRGQFPAEPEKVAAPGVTAEGGSNPPLGAAASSSSIPRKRTFRADSGRPFDLIDHLEGEVGKIDPTLIQQENPNWRPIGAARKLFKKGGVPADTALNAITYGGDSLGLRRDTPIDQFGDAINQAAAGRKTWRKLFYRDERFAKEQSRQTSAFQKDVGQASKGTAPLVQDDLNEGDTFTLKGAKFKVTRLDFDEDGRVTHLTLDDGKKYGTQEVDGQTALRMDSGSLVKAPETPGLGGDLFSEAGQHQASAEKIAQALEKLKSGIKGGASGNLHLFGVPADLWDRAIGLAQYLIRSGGKIADAINEAIVYIRKNFDGPFDESAARQHFDGALNEYQAGRKKEGTGASEYLPNEDGRGEVPPAAGARPVADIKADVAKAEVDLHTAIRERPGKGKEGAQRQAMATAKYRLLRDELLSHPDYVAETLKAHHDAIIEANAMLKPYGLAVRADDFPNPSTLHQKLSPAQFKRFGELSNTIASTHAELGWMPKKLVSSVHAQMEADGRLPKSPTLTDLGAGRTLDRMTQALKNSDIDSPRGTLAERMAIGKRVADAVTGVKDFATRAMLKAHALWKAGVEGFKHPPIDDDYRTAKKSWISYDERTSIENYQYARAMVVKVPLKVRRMAISVWLDADGDQNVLRSQLADVPDRFKEIWQAALKLTPDEKRIALDMKANFSAKLDDALATGLVEKGREDYGVPQRWKTPPQTGESADPFGESRKGSPGNPYAKLDPRDPFFSFQRSTPSYFDGIMAKGVPENLDIAHLVTVYDQSFHKALGSRGWIAALQDAMGRDGLPVVKISGKASMANSAEGGRAYFVDSKAHAPGDVTADGRPYRAIDHFALRDWKVAFKDKDGNPIIVKGDMLVHPDYFDDVKNELETPKWTQKGLGAATLKVSAFLKASKFVGPFHIVTEALHASFHGVVPSVHGFAIDLKDPKQALLARNMTLGFGKAREMFEDGLSSHKGIWAHVPWLGDVVVMMNNYMFNEYIPRLKIKVGLAVLDRNVARYSGKLTPEQIAELTGRQMDAAFGGQNWRLMGTNKSTLGVLRLGFVAPDFLLSRAKVVAQAFKPYNQEQRVFLLAQTAGVYALCRVLNATFSNNNDPHWEAGNWDQVVIGDRAYHARFIVSDAANLARDLLGLGSFHQHGIPFISGRLGVVPKTGIEALTGKDLFTGRDKTGIFATDNPALKAFSIVAQDTAQWMTPMAVDGFIKGTAHGQSGAESLMTSLVGVSSRPANPEMPEKHAKR